MARMASRSSDEVLLRALRLRRLGMSARKIAEVTGTSAATLSDAIPRIRADDMRLSGEPPEEVAAAYEKRTGK